MKKKKKNLALRNLMMRHKSYLSDLVPSKFLVRFLSNTGTPVLTFNYVSRD